jgi:hypothetical protein
MNQPVIASLFFLSLLLIDAAHAQEQPIRAGMIGLDIFEVPTA